MYARHIKKQLDALKTLQRIIEKKTHIGAGIHVQLTVGEPSSDNAKPFSFTLVDGTLSLKELEVDLIGTIEESTLLAKSEIKDLQSAVDEAEKIKQK